MRTQSEAALVILILLLAGASCGERPKVVRRTGGGGGGPRVLPEPVRIVVEAETGAARTPKDRFAPFEVAQDDGASGGKCVLLAETWAGHQELHPTFRTRDGGALVSMKKATPDSPIGKALVPNGTVEVAVEVKRAARYVVWVRAWFHCGCADTFFLSVDSLPPVDTDGDGTYDERPPLMFYDSTHERWRWVRKKGVTFDLSAGEHVVRIFNREDGLKIDQVLLAEVMEGPVDEYIPQGIEQAQP